jgi:hypothetical protein
VAERSGVNHALKVLVETPLDGFHIHLRRSSMHLIDEFDLRGVPRERELHFGKADEAKIVWSG